MGDYQPLVVTNQVDYLWAFWLLMCVLAGAVLLMLYIFTRRKGN
jgi:hypothetical protein